MRRNKLLVIAPLFLSVATVLAIYASTMSFSITGLATGSTPDSQDFSCSINIPEVGTNTTCNEEYFNDNGAISLEMSCNDLSVSNVSNCVWEPGKDAKVWITVNSETKNCQGTPIFDMIPGQNSVNITVEPHQKICPSIAVNIGIVGTLV